MLDHARAATARQGTEVNGVRASPPRRALKDEMRPRVQFKLRDAPAGSLNIYEKMFLIVVESRGVSYASTERNCADMCMSRSTYFKTYRVLKGRGLIRVQTKFNAKTGKSEPSKIRVNETAVDELTVRHTDSVHDTDSVVRHTDQDSPPHGLDSPRDNTQKRVTPKRRTKIRRIKRELEDGRGKSHVTDASASPGADDTIKSQGGKSHKNIRKKLSKNNTSKKILDARVSAERAKERAIGIAEVDKLREKVARLMHEPESGGPQRRMRSNTNYSPPSTLYPDGKTY